MVNLFYNYLGFFLFFLFINLPFIHAQKSNYISYNESNSLLKSTFTLSIISDNNNDIWVCSFDKEYNLNLTKFNGKNWEAPIKLCFRLSSDYSFGLVCDINNQFWLINEHKLYLLKYENENFIYEQIGENEKIGEIYSIAIDNNNVKWLGTKNSLVKYDNNSFTVYNSNNTNGFPSEGHLLTYLNNGSITLTGAYFEITSIAIVGSNIWATSKNGLIKYNGNKCELLFSCLVDASNNPQYIEYWNGMNSIMAEPRPPETAYIKNKKIFPCEIYSVVKDFSNNILVSTENGIYVFNGAIWKTLNTTNTDFPNNKAYSIKIDNNNNKWLSFWDVSGIVKYDGTKCTYYNSDNSNLPNTKYLAVSYIDNNNNKWFSIEGGVAVFNEAGIKFNEPKKKSQVYVSTSEQSNNNTSNISPNKQNSSLNSAELPLAFFDEIKFDKGFAYLKSNGNIFTGNVVEMDNKNINPVYTADYSDGKKNGIEIRYFTGKKKCYKKNYSDGLLNGKCTYWYENGKIYYEENYINGKKTDGTVKKYYDDGKLKSEEYYLNEEKEGKQYGWYKNGQKWFEEYCINGIREKKYNEWHDNGQLKKTVTYLLEKTVDSLVVEYDNSGKILNEGKYKNGLFDGVQRNIEKGSIKESVFINGTKHSESSFKNDKLDGVSIKYFETESIFNEDLKKKEEIKYENGLKNGLSTTWYKNGKKESEKSYAKGQFNGKSILYYENGQKKSETNYIMGVKENIITTWFENGQKQSEGMYKDGMKNGTFVEYDNNGTVILKTIYKNNEIDK